MNVDFDDDYYKNNVNYDQHITLHLDNIQTINEDFNNEAKIGMLNLRPKLTGYKILTKVPKWYIKIYINQNG